MYYRSRGPEHGEVVRDAPNLNVADQPRSPVRSTGSRGESDRASAEQVAAMEEREKSDYEMVDFYLTGKSLLIAVVFKPQKGRW